MLGVLYYMGLYTNSSWGVHHLPRFFLFTWSAHEETLEGFRTTYVPPSSIQSPVAGNINHAGGQQSPETIFACRWIQIRVAELSSVMTTSMAMIALAAAAYSWYDIKEAFWFSKFVFGASMILSFTALCKAYQQTRILLRISCCFDPASRVRRQLGNVKDGEWVLNQKKIAAWESSIVTLNGGIIALLIGLGTYFLGSLQVCNASWECDEAKIAYLLIPVAAYCGLEFYSSNVLMYRGIEAKEKVSNPA